MRAAAGLVLVGIVVGVLAFVAPRASADARAVLLGVVVGTLSALPAGLLVIVVARRWQGEQERRFAALGRRWYGPGWEQLGPGGERDGAAVGCGLGAVGGQDAGPDAF